MGKRQQMVALAIWEPRSERIAVLAVPPPEGIELYAVTTADPAAAAREVRKYLASGGTRCYVALGWTPAQAPAAIAEAG